MGLSTAILIDPAARGLAGGLRWARREAEVLRRLGPAELVRAEGPAGAEQAAWEAAMAGYGRLIAVGDLLTAHGVVNGLMRLAEGHRRGLKVGFLSLTYPDAWFRALGLPNDFDRQLEILSAAHVLPIDVGRVTCAGMDGAVVTRHFFAGAALGLGPAPNGGGAWWRAIAAAAGTVADQLRGCPPRAVLTCDGGGVHRGILTLGLAMLSTHYPGLGAVAPHANPADGALDICWIGSPNAGTVAARMVGLLLRRPLLLDWVVAREARLECLAGTLAVEVDGVPIGQSPADLSVAPRALPVIVEAVADRLRERQKALLTEVRGAALAGGVERALGR